MSESTYMQVTITVPVTYYIDDGIFTGRVDIDLGDNEVAAVVREAVAAHLKRQSDEYGFAEPDPFERDGMDIAKENFYGKE